MLYMKNTSRELNKNLFKNPTCEYRGTPFWAWNCKLDKELLETQIDCLKEMGLGGFHMHSRTGMATKYLSEEYMELIKACVDKAEKENMLAWLYDEDRWPSGAAGGLLTKDPRYRVRKLNFTQKEMEHCVSKEKAIKTGEPYYVACYDVVLNDNGELLNYARIEPETEPEGEKWFAYCLTNEASPWYNNQTYADTLSKEAIERFIAITYDAYKEAVGDRFGSIVPAIFTDEPQFQKKTTLDYATSKQEVTLPWTNDVTETYAESYKLDILESLPELIWELSDGKISKARYLYHDHIAERFAAAFADSCGKWCEKNNLMLTGHLMEEPTLKSQTTIVGEAMRSYRSFQLPGIDILCDRVELTTAKQAQSAAHQYNREGVLSELYGVTNWDFDFRGHKFQGDWQAALGVTVRVPHLSWVSMAGEAKRDYPASISYQSPWYKEYPYVEDHFARVNTALTRGKPVVKVGVVHPIESYWLHWGPNENTDAVRKQLDDNFQNITKWLLYGQVDFDFICESLLPDLCKEGSYPLEVGHMRYETIVVPACETLRRTTLERLKDFKKKGGNLIFAGECPRFIDAVLSCDAAELYDQATQVDFNQISILDVLKKDHVIEIRNENGTLADNLLYSMREDGECKWLFIAQGIKTVHVDVTKSQRIMIRIFGEHTPFLYNTITGDITDIEYRVENGSTWIETEMYCHDSLLLKLDKYQNSGKIFGLCEKNKTGEIDFKHKVAYKRSEPNVLLLDTARYALNGGEWMEEEEVLRLDNNLRKAFGWPLRKGHIAQPWTLDEEIIDNYVMLQYTIQSEIDVAKPVLAIEDAEKLEVWLNNEKVNNTVTGYYVDHSIKTVNLPGIRCGENTLKVKIPFGKTTNIEVCFILGDFNVRVEGFEKTITEPTGQITFSSITNQGMPFYGGNITYETEIETGGGNLVVKANNYRGAIIAVHIDGKRAGVITYAPYRLSLGNVPAGKHTIAFTLFGNRHNTFGALHNADTAKIWLSPDAWRTTGDAWCYEYKLKDFGILTSPTIENYE